MIRRLVLVLLFAALGACGGGGGDVGDTGAARAPRRVSGPPPWALGSNQADRIEAAGLPKLRAEGSVVHYHAHLDVFYDGEAVLVPSGIGIDTEKQVISPVHTHTAAGIIHVEANGDARFILQQFLIEWGVNPDLPLTVYVNGKKNPEGAHTVIAADTEIAMVFGTPPAEIPSTYDCRRSPGDSCDQIPQPPA